MKSGVPYDVAFSLDEAERIGFVVALGSLGGLTFDWRRLKWNQPETGIYDRS